MKTKRQHRHPGSRSKSHELDKREGEARRKIGWLAFEGPQHPSPKRSFGLLEGHEYRLVENQWIRCEGKEEFSDFLERISPSLSYYMGRTKRNGVEINMRRPATPMECLTSMFSPWVCDWVVDAVLKRIDPRPKLAAIRNKWLDAAQEALALKRRMIGYSFHADTSILHFDLIVTRQDGLGGRIGRSGLNLVGPWCTAVDRQIRAGAVIRGEKQTQFQRSIDNFHHRYGDEVIPLDILLSRALDQASDDVLGDELTNFREAYARSVPQLESLHIDAQLAALERAKAKLQIKTMKKNNDLEMSL